jgi:hypothetical protein
MIDIKKLRLIIFLFLILITPLGFLTKFYTGPAQNWVADNFSGVLYEIFWCLILQFFFPVLKQAAIAVSVLVATTILEFLQLWHPPFLENIRQNFLGRTLIGNSFSWLDLPYYVIGCFLGWVLLRFCIYLITPSWANSSATNSAK